VAAAAALTLALNRHPDSHHAAVAVADVAGALRRGAFDLVAANSPWVPLDDAVDHDAVPRERFSHGGDVGIELPQRFLLEGAELLRPGGIAITLALDVVLADASEGVGASGATGGAGDRPLAAMIEDLRADGFVVAVLPTPFNRERPELLEVARSRQPRIVDATHVAVVVARPRHDGDERRSLLVAIEALRSRWANREVSAAASAVAAGR
jgi:hypothetical protein